VYVCFERVAIDTEGRVQGRKMGRVKSFIHVGMDVYIFHFVTTFCAFRLHVLCWASSRQLPALVYVVVDMKWHGMA
jgi:hypothetical protein